MANLKPALIYKQTYRKEPNTDQRATAIKQKPAITQSSHSSKAGIKRLPTGSQISSLINRS